MKKNFAFVLNGQLNIVIPHLALPCMVLLHCGTVPPSPFSHLGDREKLNSQNHILTANIWEEGDIPGVLMDTCNIDHLQETVTIGALEESPCYLPESDITKDPSPPLPPTNDPRAARRIKTWTVSNW